MREWPALERARDGGLLVIKWGVHRNIIRFLAPITLSDADLDEALGILREAAEGERLASAA